MNGDFRKGSHSSIGFFCANVRRTITQNRKDREGCGRRTASETIVEAWEFRGMQSL